VQPCPDARNDSIVRGRQGELVLCDACTEFRLPPFDLHALDNVNSDFKPATDEQTSAAGLHARGSQTTPGLSGRPARPGKPAR